MGKGKESEQGENGSALLNYITGNANFNIDVLKPVEVMCMHVCDDNWAPNISGLPLVTLTEVTGIYIICLTDELVPAGELLLLLHFLGKALKER